MNSVGKSLEKLFSVLENTGSINAAKHDIKSYKTCHKKWRRQSGLNKSSF